MHAPDSLNQVAKLTNHTFFTGSFLLKVKQK